MSHLPDPVERFDDFFGFFLGTLEPGEFYCDFFTPCVKLLPPIVRTGGLPPAIIRDTQRFLDIIVPQIMEKILGFGVVQPLEKISNFFEKFLMLIPWAIHSDKFELYHNLKGMLSDNTMLYRSNAHWRTKHRPALIAKFVAFEYLTVIAMRIVDECKVASFEHFEAFFTLMALTQKEKPVVFSEELLRKIFRSFGELICRMDSESFGTLDREMVHVTVGDAVLVSAEMDNSPLFKRLIDIAYDLFCSENKEEQVRGADIFGAFLSVSCPVLPKSCFTDFISGKGIVDMMLSREMDAGAFMSLKDILIEYVKSMHVPVETMISIWKTGDQAKNAGDFEKFYAEVLYNMPEKKRCEIVHAMEQVNVPGISSVVVLTELIFTTMTERDKNMMSGVTSLIDVLFCTVKGKRYSDRVMTNVKRLVGEQSTKEAREAVFAKCIANLNDSSSCEFASDLLAHVARAAVNLHVSFNKSTMDVLKKCILNENVLKVMMVLIERKHVQIDEYMVKTLVAAPNDDIWTFWSSLFDMQLDKKLLIGESSLKIMRDYAEAQHSNVSMAYVTFVAGLMKLVNIGCRKLSYARSMCVDAVPLLMDDVLIEMSLSVEDMRLARVAQSAVTDLYKTCTGKRQEDAVMRLTELIPLDDKGERLRRGIEMIHSFCKEVEKDMKDNDIPVERHGQRIDVSGEIDLRIKLPDGSEEQFNVDRQVSSKALLLMLSPCLDSDPYSYSLYKNNILITYEKPLATGLTEVEMEIKKKTTYGSSQTTLSTPKTCPSITLVRAGWTKALLNIMSSKGVSPDALSACVRILYYLPSDICLVKESCDPVEFVKAVEKHSSCWKYRLEVIQWRITSSHYLKKYRDDKKAVTRLHEMLQIDALGDTCTREIVDIIARVCPTPRDTIIPILLARLSNNNALEIAGRERIASYLRAVPKSWWNENLSKVIKYIEVIMRTATQTVWYTFRNVIDCIDDYEPLLKIAESEMGKSNPHFNEIYTRLLAKSALTSDPKSCIEQCLRCSDDMEQGYTEKVLSDISKHRGEGLKECADLMERVLGMVLDGKLTINADLIDFLVNMGKMSEVNNAVIHAFVEKIGNYVVDRWSVSAPPPHVEGFPGLRNLGATCYMNSVLQAILRIPAFQYRLMQEHLDPPDRSFDQLQKLLHFMAFSVRRYCDTKPFCDSWRGWEKNPINVKEQQDAYEFMTMFLDQLPPAVRSLFEGKLVNVIEVKRNKVAKGGRRKNARKTTNNHPVKIPEVFFGIGLSVKGVSHLNDAIRELSDITLLTGEDQYTLTSSGKKVDAKSFRQIEVAPPILVFHLKRFEYDTANAARVRVNSRVEIPDEIDIGQHLVEQRELRYALRGAVVHAGDADHGHYMSLMRINGQWINFNDLDVTKISEQDFRDDSFGDGTIRAAAYLVFYAQVGATVDGIDITGDFDIPFIPEMKQIVLEDNNMYMFDNCACGCDMLSLMLQMADVRSLISFFFNVFCHTRKGELAEQFVCRITELITDHHWAIDTFKKNFPQHIGAVYMNCTVPEIVKAVSAVVKATTDAVDSEESVDLIEQLVHMVVECTRCWRQIPAAADVVFDWLSSKDDRTDIGRARSWCRVLVQLVDWLVDVTHSRIVIENIELQSVFRSIKVLVTLDDQEYVKKLLRVLQEPNMEKQRTDDFKKLMLQCTEIGVFSIGEVAPYLPSEFSKEMLLEMEVKRLEEANFVEATQRMLGPQKIPLVDLLNALTSNVEVLHKCLAANVPLLASWLVKKEANQRQKQLIRDIIKRLSLSGNAQELFESLCAVVERGSSAHAALLTSITDVLVIAKPPRDEPPAWLDDGRQGSFSLYPLLAYYNITDMIVMFEKDVKSSRGCRSKTDVMLKWGMTLQLCSDDTFLALMKLPLWKQLSLNGREDKNLANVFEALDSRKYLAPEMHDLLVDLVFSTANCMGPDWIMKIGDDLVPRHVSRTHAAFMKFWTDYQCNSRLVKAISQVGVKLLNRVELTQDDSKILNVEDRTMTLRFESCNGCIHYEYIVQYIVACCKHNTEFATRVQKLITKWVEKGVCMRGAILAQFMLFLPDHVRATEDIPRLMLEIHMSATKRPRNPTPLDRGCLYGCYSEILREHDPEMRGFGVTLVCLLWDTSDAVIENEQEFFREMMLKMTADALTSLIKTTCASMQRNGGAPVKRVTFITRLFPERCDEIRDMISKDVIDWMITNTFDASLTTLRDILHLR